jgi:hypothetical protein
MWYSGELLMSELKKKSKVESNLTKRGRLSSYFIVCPPLSEYQEQPVDQSVSTLENCPQCEQKMWVSVKKKLAAKEAKKNNHELWMMCYTCMMKAVEEDKYVRDILRQGRIMVI